MTDISMVGPDGGELVLTGPVRMRILEDGSTTGHRLGIGGDHHRPPYRGAAAAPARPPRRGVLRRVRHGQVHRGGPGL